MSTTDEELLKKQQGVEKLRQQVADANAAREARERALSNDITAGELDREAERLQAELAYAKEAAKASSVNAGVAVLLDPDKAAAADAAARTEALGVVAPKEA